VVFAKYEDKGLIPTSSGAVLAEQETNQEEATELISNFLPPLTTEEFAK
jgi:hypothetical protein